MLETFVSPGRKNVWSHEEQSSMGFPLLSFVFLDHQSIPLFAIYCSVTYFLVTFQGFFYSLLYCFLNTEVKFVVIWFANETRWIFIEVRETLTRRLEATSIWACWKRYLGKKGRYGADGSNSDDRTRSELLIPSNHSTSVCFFCAFSLQSHWILLEENEHGNGQSSIGNQWQWNHSTS